MLAAPARAGEVPNWRLELRVAHWVAPSSFAATIVKQLTGLKTRIGRPVVFVLDRRTVCSQAAGSSAAATRIRCASLRAQVAARPSLLVIVSGQFETGHLGAIGFRARSVVVEPGA